MQVTFAAEFDEAQNVTEEGIALDDISMTEGSCAAAGYCCLAMYTIDSLPVCVTVNVHSGLLGM